MTLFSGLSAFPITPADEDGKINAADLTILLERLVNADVNSIGLLGSTGGYAYLSRSERKRAIKVASDFLGKRIPLIASVGAIRTDEVVRLAYDASDAGADGLLLAPVSYTPLTQEEAFEHYSCVAAETGLPLCIYNNPGTTHFSFSYELLERLAHVPNIEAVKMPLPNDGDAASELERLRPNVPSEFSIGYSGDWGCAACMLAGADAWYSVVGGLFPEQTMRLANAAFAKNADEVKRIDAFFQPMWSLFQEFGSLRVFYAAANILALTDANPHRPLLPLPTEQHQRLREAMEALERLS